MYFCIDANRNPYCISGHINHAFSFLFFSFFLCVSFVAPPRIPDIAVGSRMFSHNKTKKQELEMFLRHLLPSLCLASALAAPMKVQLAAKNAGECGGWVHTYFWIPVRGLAHTGAEGQGSGRGDEEPVL